MSGCAHQSSSAEGSERKDPRGVENVDVYVLEIMGFDPGCGVMGTEWEGEEGGQLVRRISKKVPACVSLNSVNFSLGTVGGGGRTGSR